MLSKHPKRVIDPEQRRGVPLTVTLALAVGLLVLVGVGGVLVMGIYTSAANTFSLVRENIEILIDAAESKVRDELRPASRQLRYLSDQIAQRRLDPANRPRLQDLFEGAMSAAPQIHSLAFFNTRYEAVVVDRTKWRVSLFHQSMADNAEVRTVVEAASARRAPAWGPPTWIERYGDTFVATRQPVWRDDKFLGVLVATLSVGDLSQAMVSIIAGNGKATGFVLYGRDQVLAHPALVRKDGRQTDRAKPLPTVEDFDDGVLASMCGPTTGIRSTSRCARASRAMPSMPSAPPIFTSIGNSPAMARSPGSSAATSIATSSTRSAAASSSWPAWAQGRSSCRC
ncbi:MAG: cache domain-containing protein [Proteobacteria bacterium]|nr:cache domain-containing protein [Pseudomonadota bacterium]